MTALRELASQDGANGGTGVLAPEAPLTPQIGLLVTQQPATLADCEDAIKKGTKAFAEVGKALEQIRDGGLLPAEFGDFKAYLKARWPRIGVRRAEQYIKAARTNKMFAGVPWQPENEGHARALSELTAQEAAIVAQVIKATAANGRVTAKHIKSVIQVFRDVLATGAIDGGEGEDIAITDANLLQLSAVIAEETVERWKRHIEYIAGIDAWKRVSTVVVTDATALFTVLQAIEGAFGEREKLKISYYVEKEEQAS